MIILFLIQANKKLHAGFHHLYIIIQRHKIVSHINLSQIIVDVTDYVTDHVSFKLIHLSLSFLTFLPACTPTGEKGSFVQNWSQLTKGVL